MRKKHDKILNKLSKKFNVINVEYFSSYFIYELDEDAICHFELEETPGWAYGIWITKSGTKIFGEHEDLIDKFKPYGTYISCNNIPEFIEIVSNISIDPDLYFVDSLTYGDALVDFKIEKRNGMKFYYGYQVSRRLNEKTGLYDIVYRDKSITQESFVESKLSEYHERNGYNEKRDS